MSLVTARLSRVLGLLAALLVLAAPARAQWINEVHYDNVGGDEGEAVEVVLPSAANPAAFDLYLYNGNGGAVYDGPLNLDQDFLAGETSGDFTVYSLAVVVQNGDPDGLALTENGTLVPGQFLSYEGTFTAVGGPADGETSTDIGVAEGGDTPVGLSLQLVGTGTAYGDFAWQAPADDSFGSVNDGQTFGAPTDDPIVRFFDGGGSAEEGGLFRFGVEIDYPDNEPDGVPVTVEITFDAAASTASSDDFSGPTPATVTFSGDENEEFQFVEVILAVDDETEGDETAFFDLAVTDGTATVGMPATYSLTIRDEDDMEEARVQIIHNAPDPIAETVNVVFLRPGIVGPFFEDVPFRSATAFFDLDPDTYIVSVDTDGNEIFNSSVTLEAGETYQLIVGGVADPSGFQTNPDGADIAARLFVNETAREAADGPGQVRFNVTHGVTDAPAFDLRRQSDELLLVNDLAYGEITDYAGVPATEYVLELTSANGTTVFATFLADFSEFGGHAFSLLASGFATPGNEDDTNGEPQPFGLLAVFPDGQAFLLPQVVETETIAEARAAPLGSLVTVEGTVTRAMGDFTRIQDTTAALTIRQTFGPLNEDVNDGTITPGTVLRVTGTTSEFASLLQINDEVEDEDDYEVLGTDDLPMAQLVTLADLAENGEAYESELVQIVNLTIVTTDDDFQPATTYDIFDESLSTGEVALRVPDADDTALDGTPVPPSFFDYTGVVSQFDFDDPEAGYQLNPVQESDVEPQDILLSQLQIIHNAPDPAFTEVDVYVDSTLLEDDLAFRTATAFFDVSADVELEVAVAPGDSDSADDAVFTETYTLDDELNYQLVASGVGEGDFEPNPDGEAIAFTLLVNDDAKLFSETDDTVPDLNFVHGTTDAPTIDVRTGETQDIILYDDVAYGEIAPYQPIPPEPQTLEVTTADGATTVATFEVDLTGRIDEAGTILASGFLTPENEDDTNGEPPSFGLLVVFADGSEEFVEPLTVSAEDGAALPEVFALGGNYPNPFATRTTVRYDLPADATVSLDVFDVLGRRVLSLAPEAVAAGAGRTLDVEASLPSGAYLYRLTAETPSETLTETGRMTVVR